MWPWEHVLFAYVFYSIFVRLRYRAAPEDWSVMLLMFGSVLPDIVDKPLAWQFALFDFGYAVAHSVFVAVPLSLLVGLAAKRRKVFPVGLAFVFGYLLHLVGDVLPASLSKEKIILDPILWPFGNPQVSVDPGSFAEGVYTLLSAYVLQLFSLDLTPVVALQLGSIVFGTILWLNDGCPGPDLLIKTIRRAAVRLLLR